MRIKSINLVIAILNIIMLSACGNNSRNQEISYTKRVSADSLYQLEIPTEFHDYKIIGDMMSFIKDHNGNAMASIMELPYNSNLDSYISSCQNNSFTYTTISGNGSNTRCFKVIRGNNFWSSYDYYGIKDIIGTTYVINLNSDSYSKEKMDNVFNHMYETLVSLE